jgi:hypothetical protein
MFDMVPARRRRTRIRGKDRNRRPEKVAGPIQMTRSTQSFSHVDMSRRREALGSTLSLSSARPPIFSVFLLEPLVRSRCHYLRKPLYSTICNRDSYVDNTEARWWRV